MLPFHHLQAEDLKARLSDPGALLLDCRKVKDYQDGHIDNALHVHDDLVMSLLNKKEYQKPLVIYCYHGHQSEHLAEMFATAGFTQAYSLVGGYDGWREYCGVG